MQKMRKMLVVMVAIAAVAIATVSCTHHTCPAYRGSVAMAEVVE